MHGSSSISSPSAAARSVQQQQQRTLLPPTSPPTAPPRLTSPKASTGATTTTAAPAYHHATTPSSSSSPIGGGSVIQATQATSFRYPTEHHQHGDDQHHHHHHVDLANSLTLDTYQSYKYSLAVQEQYEADKERRQIAGGISSCLSFSNNDNDKQQQRKKNANVNSSMAEVQSLRREQNETAARREQLKVWVAWLRTALRTFASPVAAVELFVKRTTELCAKGVDAELFAELAKQHEEKKKKHRLFHNKSHHHHQHPATTSGGGGTADSNTTPTGTLQQQQQQRQQQQSSPGENRNNKVASPRHHNSSGGGATGRTGNCSILAAQASLVALLALGEVWCDGTNSVLPATPHANKQRNLQALIRAVCDDLACGVFFSPPSTGCSSPEDVVANLGGARAFSDVFNDMLSVAVFHRDRAEKCRYLEARREAVLNRCIDNFRKEHTRWSLRMWRLYTFQRLRQRKRIWERLLHQRDNQVMRESIEVWKKFSTHVHLASIASANRKIEQLMSDIRLKNKTLEDRVATLQADGARRQKEKEDAQERYDVVEVRNSKSRDRMLSATEKYNALRKEWSDVIYALFNDNNRIQLLTASSAAAAAAGLVVNSNSNNNEENNNNMHSAVSASVFDLDEHQQWGVATKAIQWAKWVLSVYAPETLKQWEAEAKARQTLSRTSGHQHRSGGGGGGGAGWSDTEDRFGDIPYVSITAIRDLLGCLVNLHVPPKVVAMLSRSMYRLGKEESVRANAASSMMKTKQQSDGSGGGNVLSQFGADPEEEKNDARGAAEAAAAASFGKKEESMGFFDDSFNVPTSTNNTTTPAAARHISRLLGIAGADGSHTAASEMMAHSAVLQRQNINAAASVRLPGAAVATAALRHEMAQEIWDLYMCLCDNSFATMAMMMMSTAATAELDSSTKTKQQQKKAANLAGGDDDDDDETTKDGNDGSETADTTTHKKNNNNNGQNQNSDETQEQQQSAPVPATTRSTSSVTMPSVPPISTIDLVRQDQLRMVLFVIHLAQLWSGGHCGTFFKKSREDKHDRNPPMMVSRLAQQPRQGQLATIEETEDMMSDWSQCVRHMSSNTTETVNFQSGVEEGMRDAIEFGEFSFFRQTLQGLFDLLTLGDIINKRRVEQLLLCVRRDAVKPDSLAEAFQQQQQQQQHDEKKETRASSYSRQQHQKPGGGGTMKMSVFPPWPNEGIANISELGIYITEAAAKLGFSRRVLAEQLTQLLLQSSDVAFAHAVFVPSEELKALFAKHAAVIHRLFQEHAVVSRKLAPSLTATAQQQQQKQQRAALTSKIRAKVVGNSQQQQQPGDSNVTLVFSKRSFLKWLEVAVVRAFGNKINNNSKRSMSKSEKEINVGGDTTTVGGENEEEETAVECGGVGVCPTEDEAEALYVSAVHFAPERDLNLVHLLMCATAVTVYPSPFVSLEEKFQSFCQRVF